MRSGEFLKLNFSWYLCGLQKIILERLSIELKSRRLAVDFRNVKKWRILKKLLFIRSVVN